LNNISPKAFNIQPMFFLLSVIAVLMNVPNIYSANKNISQENRFFNDILEVNQSTILQPLEQ
jgi:hypothetical protein